jgi:hypothetical protein
MTDYYGAELRTQLEVLDGLKLEEGVDYETIGKVVTALVLRQHEDDARSSQPDAEGHVRLEGTLRYKVTIHPKKRYVCCDCWNIAKPTTEGWNCMGFCCPPKCDEPLTGSAC